MTKTYYYALELIKCSLRRQILVKFGDPKNKSHDP